MVHIFWYPTEADPATLQVLYYWLIILSLCVPEPSVSDDSQRTLYGNCASPGTLAALTIRTGNFIYASQITLCTVVSSPATVSSTDLLSLLA